MSSRRRRPNISKSSPNLRKDNPNLDKKDIDLEKKNSEPSVPEVPITFERELDDGLIVTASAGGVGIGREYELSDSDSLEFSAEVDWSIIDVDISQTAGGTGVSGSVELPGDLLGLGAGVVIDLSTGEISGGEISAEAGTVGLTVGIAEGGCEVSVGISIMGFGVTYTRDRCEDDKDDDNDNDDDDRERDVEDSHKEAIEEAKEWEEYEKSLPAGCQIRLTLAGWQVLGSSKAGAGYHSVILNKAKWKSRPYGSDYFNFPLFDGGDGYHSFNEHYYPSWLDPDRVVIHSRRCPSPPSQVKEVLSSTYANFPMKIVGWSIHSCLKTWPHNPKGKNKQSPPSPPPMREKECCRESIKLMREIHKALAVRELLDNNLIVPNRLIAPNAKGVAKLKNYLDILQWQIRMTDHLGIHPFKALVTDANAAKKGNQQIEIQAMNATSATRQIMELLLENKGDSATRLNLQVRIAVAVGQILNAVSIAAKSIEQIVQFLGMPRNQKVLNVKFPFDFTFGKGGKKGNRGKGFGPSSRAQDKLDINTEEATEALLPDFMQDKEQPIVVEMFDDSQPTLLDEIHDKK